MKSNLLVPTYQHGRLKYTWVQIYSYTWWYLCHLTGCILRRALLCHLTLCELSRVLTSTYIRRSNHAAGWRSANPDRQMKNERDREYDICVQSSGNSPQMKPQADSNCQMYWGTTKAQRAAGAQRSARHGDNLAHVLTVIWSSPGASLFFS